MTPSAEYDLLLDTAVPRSISRAKIQDWDERRWGLALEAAQWHRLSPALFCHLERTGGAPAAVRTSLEQGYLANAARNALLAATTRELVTALESVGIPAMLLKGAALLECAYPDPAIRELLDLDLLVPPGRLAMAETAVRSLGYRAMVGSEPPDNPPAGRAGHHDAALVSANGLLAVELHRHITLPEEGGAFDIGEMWERAEPSESGGHLLPCPSDLLLHICVHCTRNRLGGSARNRHSGGALAQMLDVAQLLAHTAVDWDSLTGAAVRYRLGTWVFLALFAASELGIPVPEETLRQLRPPGFADELGRRLVSLRILRGRDHLPVRNLRWMVAPGRDSLATGWSADPYLTSSLALAYLRRARAQLPLARADLHRPWQVVQDHRLNSQILALPDGPR